MSVASRQIEDLCTTISDLRAERNQLSDQIRYIKEAAIKHGVNDEVAAAIAHAELIARQKETA